MCHHAQLISVFSVEMGFHHVGQVGLELLTSQSAGIIGVSHHAWPRIINLTWRGEERRANEVVFVKS